MFVVFEQVGKLEHHQLGYPSAGTRAGSGDHHLQRSGPAHFHLLSLIAQLGAVVCRRLDAPAGFLVHQFDEFRETPAYCSALGEIGGRTEFVGLGGKRRGSPPGYGDNQHEKKHTRSFHELAPPFFSLSQTDKTATKFKLKLKRFRPKKYYSITY
jgi:hypothetical protein